MPRIDKRRAALLAAVTVVAVIIELVQRRSAVKITLSAWLPALILFVYWTRMECRSTAR